MMVNKECKNLKLLKRIKTEEEFTKRDCYFVACEYFDKGDKNNALKWANKSAEIEEGYVNLRVLMGRIKQLFGEPELLGKGKKTS
jgi:hypothetical protein